MRMLILPLLLLANTAIHANRMHVVVSTRDRVVVEYRCEERASALEEGPAFRRVLRDPGHLTWHGVGGVAPYTLISDERDGFGNICITIMDATGNMATGCSIMRERRLTIPVECEPLPSEQIPSDSLRTDHKKLQEHIAYRDSLNGVSDDASPKARGTAEADRDARDRGTREPVTRERTQREIVPSRDRGVRGNTHNERPVVRERRYTGNEGGTSTTRQGRPTQSTGQHGGSGSSHPTVSPR